MCYEYEGETQDLLEESVGRAVVRESDADVQGVGRGWDKARRVGENVCVEAEKTGR